jgi:hypothetical protein
MGGAGESRLAYAVDLLVQLRRDTDCAEPALHRRDRALLPSAPARLTRSQLIIKWLDRLRSSGYPLPGATVATAFRIQLLALLIAGFVVGWGVTAALFHYDGERPINVVHVLAVLVGGQLLLLLLLGVVSLPRGISRIIPGLSVIQDILAWLSPGQITRLLARRLPGSVRGRLEDAAGGWKWDALSGRILKWAALVSAQAFGVAFNLGALAAALYLVTFSDLAFSWSTTLDPDYDRGHRLTSVLSAPWSRWLPAAVPSRGLIESTLYYRQTGIAPSEDPTRRGGWWPFLVASIAVYGLAPRGILLGLGWWRFRRTLREAMSHAAGVDSVVDRLTTEAISTQANEAEGADAETRGSISAADAAIRTGRYWIINWSGVIIDPERLRGEFARRWGGTVIELLAAGASTTSDEATIQRVTEARDNDGVIVIVKAWEPPMLDFLDFLDDLRRRMGNGRPLIVLLLGLNADGSVGAVRAGDAEQWRRRLGGLGDKELGVVVWEGERL